MVVALVVVFVALSRDVVGGLGEARLVGVLAEVDSRVVVLGFGEAPDKLAAVKGRLGVVLLAALVGVVAGSVFFSAKGDLIVAGEALLAAVREAAVGVSRDATEGDAILVGVARVVVALVFTPRVFGVLDFAAPAAGFFAPALAAVIATAAPATTPRVATIATSVSSDFSGFCSATGTTVSTSANFSTASTNFCGSGLAACIKS